MATYSFLDVNASIVGPGGSFSLGAGSANAEEGIDVDMVEDKDTLTVGADGTPMHSLHAGKAANIMVRLLKTSPVNAQLSQLYNIQTISSATHGQNVISISNNVSGDSIIAQSVAFKKQPKVTYAKDGGFMEWEFSAGIVDESIGANLLANIANLATNVV